MTGNRYAGFDDLDRPSSSCKAPPRFRPHGFALSSRRSFMDRSGGNEASVWRSGKMHVDQMTVQASREPVAIIVAPPWLRTGTGRVIEAQIEYYRARGFRTAFVAVANHPLHVKSDPMWRRFREGAEDLACDVVAIAALRRRPRPRTPLRRIRQLFCRRTALDWIIELGTIANLPVDLVDFAGSDALCVMHVNHVYTMGFAERLAKCLSSQRVPTIVDTHDIQAHIISDNGYENPWTRRQDSQDELLKREVRWLSRADVLVHISAEDLAFFSARIPWRPHVLAVPPVPGPQRSISDEAAPPADLLFVGTGHIANLKALVWFFEAVWPILAPMGLSLTIVGAVDELMRLQQPGLFGTYRSHFVGGVRSLNAYYRAARCVIAPMTSGRGISIKTIEAMAFARPLVATSKAFRGMPLDEIAAAGLLPRDDPSDFAEAVMSSLGAEQEGARNRAIYEKLFSPAKYFAAMDAANRLATQRHRHL